MFYADRKGGELMRRGGFVDGAITMTDDLGNQPTLWQERVLLNEEFYRALREHPVPLSETALRAIGPRSMVIDVYIWLAYRLHALKRDVEAGWPDPVVWNAIRISLGLSSVQWQPRSRLMDWLGRSPQNP
jgi:hypothetical protein